MENRFKFDLDVTPYTPKEDKNHIMVSSSPIMRKTRCRITLNADVDSATGSYIAGFLNSAMVMAEQDRAKKETK